MSGPDWTYSERLIDNFGAPLKFSTEEPDHGEQQETPSMDPDLGLDSFDSFEPDSVHGVKRTPNDVEANLYSPRLSVIDISSQYSSYAPYS